jgi:fibronectin-binding autotransporter adhesin
MKNSKTPQHRILKYVGAALLAVTLPAATMAAPFGLWINANTTNSYSDASKWIAIDGALSGPGGIPGPANDAYIFDGTLQVANGGDFNPLQLIMGWESFHVGEFLQTGGSTRTESWTKVGLAGNQVFNMSGGDFSAADLAVGWINPATSAVGTGVMNLSGGTFESRAATFIGLEGATGTLNISGGTFNAAGNDWGSFRIADYGTGTGTLNLSGTGVVNASRYTAVGGWGNGTLNISGGTWNQAAGGIVVGDAADLLWTGSGVVNQSGGTVNADYVLLQKGTYNLDGGDLSVYGVADTKAETTGVFNFNGGTLRARDNNADFITANTVEVKSGGGTIDTADKEVRVTLGMTGTGGLTKTGSGILKLDGANTYTGMTAVSQGTLSVNGSLAGGVSVASGSSLKGSGTIGGASTVSGTLSAGNSPGLMTFSSDLSLTNGGGFIWELFGNTSSDVLQFDRINVLGDLLVSSGSGITLDFGTAAAGSTVDWSNAFWGSDQAWTFLTVDGTTTGFSELSLDSSYLDASGNSLSGARAGASFSLSQSGNNVLVNYTVPEPGTVSLLLMGLASWALARVGWRRSP